MEAGRSTSQPMTSNMRCLSDEAWDDLLAEDARECDEILANLDRDDEDEDWSDLE
jgi:hypothetical protein